MSKVNNTKLFRNKGKLNPTVFLKFEPTLGYKDEWLEFVDSILFQKQMDNRKKKIITKFLENESL